MSEKAAWIKLGLEIFGALMEVGQEVFDAISKHEDVQTMAESDRLSLVLDNIADHAKRVADRKKRLLE